MEGKYLQLKKDNRARIHSNPYGNDSGIVDYYPAYLQIEHTNRCNAECIMCSHFYTSNRGARDVDSSVISVIEPVLKYCEQIMLNGDGEPFLCGNIADYIRLYRANGVRVSTNTNLCAVNDDMLALIAENIECLNISCDGCTRETFEGIRSPLSFDTFNYNLDKLHSIAPHTSTVLDCVVMLQNIQEIPALIDYACAHNFDAVKLHMLGVNPCIQNQFDSLSNYPNMTSHYLNIARQRARQNGLMLYAPFFDGTDIDENLLEAEMGVALNFSYSTVQRRKQVACQLYGDINMDSGSIRSLIDNSQLHYNQCGSMGRCYWPIERCYIDLNGNVTTCCYNTLYHMGNIVELGSFDAVWNGERYRNLRIMMRQGALPTFCTDCEFLKNDNQTAFILQV